jgi:Txe/YoeB family toxin of Txe-Axe toxin-antitoxin module
MFWRKKHLHGLDAISKHFKISTMDLLTWHRSRADPPPMWRENAVWICNTKAMKRWLTENGLMPKKLSLLEIIQSERKRKNEKRRVKNSENWQRTIQRHHRQGWTITDDRIKRKRLW